MCRWGGVSIRLLPRDFERLWSRDGPCNAVRLNFTVYTVCYTHTVYINWYKLHHMLHIKMILLLLTQQPLWIGISTSLFFFLWSVCSVSTIKKFSVNMTDTLRALIIQEPHYFLLLSRGKQEVLVDKIVQKMVGRRFLHLWVFIFLCCLIWSMSCFIVIFFCRACIQVCSLRRSFVP